jgi:hypothetical protein
VFLILAAKAPASVWKVHGSARGVITRLEKKREHVYHYSFHIMDPAFGHLTIKMSGHPPFGAQVIFNGHEYVAVAAQAEGSGSPRKGTALLRSRIRAWPGSQIPGHVMRLQGARARSATGGSIRPACDSGWTLRSRSAAGSATGYSVYQAEYSRNLLFASGA